MAQQTGDGMTQGPALALALRAPRSRAIKYGLSVAAAVFLLVWPLFVHDRFLYHMAITLLLAAIGASSLHLIIRTGHVSLCHAAFLGVGAYICVNLVMRLKLPFAVGILAGAGGAALLALAIGPIILRLTGKYFVLVTFLFGEIVRMVFVDWQSLTGGANGILEIPPPSPFFADPQHYYYLALALSALCVGLCARILTSEIGRAIDSIREGEQLAECAGVPVIRIKVMVFVIACGLVGFEGGVQAHYSHYVSPQAYSITESLNFIIINVIGGMTSLVGPLLGTGFIVITPELLRGYVELQQIIFGAILILVMAFLPGGLAGLGGRVRWLMGRARGAMRP